MKSDIEFLSIDDVILIHKEQIKRFGGVPGVRNRGLLEAAVTAPHTSSRGKFLYKDIFEMAAVLACLIALNNSFIEGDRRTGLLAALTFLDINGITLDTPSTELYNIMVDIEEGKKDEDDLAKLLRLRAGN